MAASAPIAMRRGMNLLIFISNSPNFKSSRGLCSSVEVTGDAPDFFPRIASCRLPVELGAEGERTDVVVDMRRVVHRVIHARVRVIRLELYVCDRHPSGANRPSIGVIAVGAE